MDQIKAAAKEAGIFVVLGYSERHESSLVRLLTGRAFQTYVREALTTLPVDCSTSPSHSSALKARLCITVARLSPRMWSAVSVVNTPFGKVSGLNCWEHLQPLLRYYEYSQGAEIHIASWPPLFDVSRDQY